MRYLKRLLSSKARRGPGGDPVLNYYRRRPALHPDLESSLRGLFRVKFAIETPHRKRICYDRFLTVLQPLVQNFRISGIGLMLAFQQRPGALQRNRLALPSHPRVGILLKDKERPRRRRFNRDLFRGPDV